MYVSHEFPSLFNLIFPFHVWKLFLCLVILSCLLAIEGEGLHIDWNFCAWGPHSLVDECEQVWGSSKENAWYSLWQNSVSLDSCPETDLWPHLLGEAWLIGLWNWGEKGTEGTTTHHTLVYWHSTPPTLSGDSSFLNSSGSCRWGVPIFSNSPLTAPAGAGFGFLLFVDIGVFMHQLSWTPLCSSHSCILLSSCIWAFLLFTLTLMGILGYRSKMWSHMEIMSSKKLSLTL